MAAEMLGIVWVCDTTAGGCLHELSRNLFLMKLPVLISVLAAATMLLGACQSSTPPPNDFAEKTHRTYNPETGSFEQSPPYGKQGNKSDEGSGQ